jgi:hypothetical protein
VWIETTVQIEMVNSCLWPRYALWFLKLPDERQWLYSRHPLLLGEL